MFKTDKEILEELSFNFNERDIANLRAITEYLKSNNLLTISTEEAQKVLQGLDTIGKLKLDNTIYSFHITDEYCCISDGTPGEGVELYLRHGDRLEEFNHPGHRDWIHQPEDHIKVLKKQGISKIYTGEIPYNSEFLGIAPERDEDDPIRTSGLDDDDIKSFEDKDIRVVKLDYLI